VFCKTTIKVTKTMTAIAMTFSVFIYCFSINQMRPLSTRKTKISATSPSPPLGA
jgi:hypothetical protein